MKPHRTPFENRWTDNEQAWRWFEELEREGVENVRAMLADREVRHADDPTVFLDVPPGFVRDWLAFRDLRERRDERRWRALITVLAALAAGASLVAAWAGIWGGV